MFFLFKITKKSLVITSKFDELLYNFECNFRMFFE